MLFKYRHYENVPLSSLPTALKDQKVLFRATAVESAHLDFINTGFPKSRSLLLKEFKPIEREQTKQNKALSVSKRACQLQFKQTI